MAHPTRLSFPDGFVWGTATAAYQIEGARDSDGRGPSIWDDFCRVPGNVLAGDTGDVACDHYHRMEADLDLMASLGMTAYRFSVAWPRVQPEGSGRVNQAGLDFYDRLVDGLLARGIRPLVTLYHWDLPSALQRHGGWVARRTAEHFADYAAVVGRALGDRVPAFGTLNEPWCSAFLGHASGVHAPGITDTLAAYTAAHHLNLAHGLAVTALRSVTPAATEISVSLNLAQVYPATESGEDRAATAHVDDIANRIFLEPMLRGQYPEELLDSTQQLADWSVVRDGDLDLIHQPLDALGVNFYTPSRIGGPSHRSVDADNSPTGRWVRDPVRGDAPAARWPGTDRAWSVPQPGPYTEMGWRIEPNAMLDLLTRLHRDYPDVPLMITENGCACADVVDETGQVQDDDRIDYLRRHLAVVHEATQRGVDLRGYYLWSFMDNFEWALGYSKRFGLVHVDYETQTRTPKTSATWYADVAAANAMPA